jgi:hypothetical protein
MAGPEPTKVEYMVPVEKEYLVVLAIITIFAIAAAYAVIDTLLFTVPLVAAWIWWSRREIVTVSRRLRWAFAPKLYYSIHRHRPHEFTNTMMAIIDNAVPHAGLVVILRPTLNIFERIRSEAIREFGFANIEIASYWGNNQFEMTLTFRSAAEAVAFKLINDEPTDDPK